MITIALWYYLISVMYMLIVIRRHKNYLKSLMGGQYNIFINAQPITAPFAFPYFLCLDLKIVALKTKRLIKRYKEVRKLRALTDKIKPMAYDIIKHMSKKHNLNPEHIGLEIRKYQSGKIRYLVTDKAGEIIEERTSVVVSRQQP